MEFYKEGLKVILKTQFLGDIRLHTASLKTPEFDYLDILTDKRLCDDIILTLDNVRFSKKINLGHTIYGDIRRFKKWNDEHDESKQIDFKNLFLHSVELAPQFNRVQLHWLFCPLEGGGLRTLQGLNNMLYTNETYKGWDLMGWPEDEFHVYF